ncbi:hypothetical protein ACFLXL_02075 [Chloroflexota bacterium]
MATKNRVYTLALICLIVTILNVVLSRFAAVTCPIVPGAASLYFAIGFMITFTLWFGLWGAIAAYLGCFIGAGLLMGMPLSVSLYWSLADLWQVIIPLVAFRTLHAGTGLQTKRDFLIFLAFGIMLNNVVGAAWGSSMLAVGGQIQWDEVAGTFAGWLIGNIIITSVIGILLLKFVTPYVIKAGLTVEKYWF